MTIGGLTVGVTPLDMAHAYETIARGGRRVSGTLAEAGAPVGIQEVDAGSQALPDGTRQDVNRVVTKPVLPAGVAATETSMLETVLQYGTARVAAIGQFAAGKTGTTSNYGDAWFIGWDSKYTVAVWVGYPNKLIPMTSDFNGGPVLGGTYPALIWHDFMISALQIDKNRAEAASLRNGSTGKGSSGLSSTGEAATSSSAPTPGPASSPTGGGKHPATGGRAGSPEGSGGGAPTPRSGSQAPEPSSQSPPQAPAGPAPAPQSPSTPAQSAPPAPSPAAAPPGTGGVSPGG